MQNANTRRSPPTSPPSTPKRSGGRQPRQRGIRDVDAAGEPTGKGSKDTYKAPSHGQSQKASSAAGLIMMATPKRHISASTPSSAPGLRQESSPASAEEPIFCIKNEYPAHLVGGDCDDIPSRTAVCQHPSARPRPSLLPLELLLPHQRPASRRLLQRYGYGYGYARVPKELRVQPNFDFLTDLGDYGAASRGVRPDADTFVRPSPGTCPDISAGIG
ncbi:hypothetical protein CYMTET_20990 [Cymbomonas tetramitiformis]|uniref:Uncharacterized protein n=1 Tax=Cymbomonas tetramitiformis TaxID=36881 RepID=A0AAE0L3P0_9CHLO|nr:hypothetical protein CYMTET_20990 [Cymbomonas tetramitiformis]